MGADARVASGPVVRRLQQDATPSLAASTASAGGSTASDAPERTPADDGEMFERLVDALEQRVLDELERRGHRHAPGVF